MAPGQNGSRPDQGRTLGATNLYFGLGRFMASKAYSIILAATLCQSAYAAPIKTSPNAALQISSAIGALLQADGPRASEQLGSIKQAELDAKDTKFRRCMLSRLSKPAPAMPIISPLTRKPDKFAQRLLSLYRTYWWTSVMRPNVRTDAERRLATQVAGLVGRPSTSLDDIEPLIESRLKQAGFYSLQGKTGKLYELMIWSREDKKIEKVALPEETNETNVIYMNDFVSLGWSSYFSCDRVGTGGWTNEAGLHVVVPNYDSLTDENFRVNFLAHESQHFADKRRYKKLASWELEYRAKLVELAFAVTTKDDVLSAFTNNQGDDIEDPHSYANKKLLIAIRQRLRLPSDANLTGVPISALHEAALAELKFDSAQRLEQLK
jgi:hypothetical protein